MISEETVRTLAARLDTAQRTVTDTLSLADTHTLAVADAYAVQGALLALREERGERITGVKLGFTSKAKMEQMGVSEIIVGRLTDAMCVPDGGAIELSRFIHPKVEPEVAYRLSRDVDPDDPATDLVSCVDAVAPALEIIDSRYRDFRFTYEDVVADNTSAAAYAIGAWAPVQDVSGRAVRLSGANREVSGSTEAILGGPVNALRALLDLARRRHIPLRAGQVVLAGAATAAIPLEHGETMCEVDGIGRVGVRGI
ncbi:4-oxalocrotonate decarboxylase [Streptomyces sp. SID9727]|uniref:2-keto-4-pentenoate hydratase n=1 Tax=Streptomyces sp. SID9727 TaxID=2706114 RepID=UPI0013CD310C|nr:4-oxalocrotonate decarboxylase [Streptomyces sp. SID9727]NEC65648.1 4-oxalocrotonate decarboxylase [Streptomyces sp. SID9727]